MFKFLSHIWAITTTYINSFRYYMFNSKHFLNPAVVMSMCFNSQITAFTTTNTNTNSIHIKFVKKVIPSFNLNSVFHTTHAVDITAFTFSKTNTVYTHNLFYNYSFNLYINCVNNNSNQQTLTTLFFNRIWLEREVLEFFPITYIGLSDTRPLLLNYGDNINYLSRATSVQPNFELKTSWHSRTVVKTISASIEL